MINQIPISYVINFQNKEIRLNKNYLEKVLGAQISSRRFLDKSATLLWKNGYKWIIQSIAHS